ncbi:MAG: DUF2341 domain-containing protein, partial [Euryarchaeota archaeon]|nr:DUF2341 domain-containing protein [Euryarchaeota archaeon]
MKKMHKKILNRWNYLVIVTVAFFLLAPSMSPAQTISGQKTQVDVIGQSTIRYTYQISKNDLMFDTFMGYDRVQFKDCQFLNDIGKPFLPYAEITIALPSGTAASQVRVIETKNEEINGKYTLFPAQPLRTMNDIDKAIDLVEPDAVTYASKQKYPVELAKFVYQTDLRGQGMAVVQVFPLQYTPGEKKLTIYTSITLEILGTQGYVCGDYLPQQTSEAERTEYKTQIMNMVVNPKDVNLVASDTGKDGGEPRGVPAGNYKYVIITKPTWVSYFQPLADWKTKKGMKATIVTTDWIYSTYTGADNQEKINAFVQDAHSTWSATFFLLGGDIDTVPVRLKYYSLFLSGANEEIYAPADTYYADYDGDFLCEVNVGRASVTAPGTGVGQIQNFINKIFTYEQNPPLTNYAKTAAMFGFNLDAGTLMETCKIAIDTAYIPADWTMSNVYDSMTGDHETAVKLYVNAGQHLINHGDHCNEYEIGVGVINHWLTLTPGEVDGFSNGNKQSIMYSMGCYPAAFDVSNCIAEHFVRDNNGGGIAFVGNSRYGIYVPGVYTTYSCRYDREFFEAIFEEERYILGEAFSDSKDESPHNDDYYRCIFDELNLLGDPQLPIWTNNPVSIVVTHPATLPTGPSSYTVHVTSGGSPVYLADVCLWKGTDIYLTGTTNSAGDCTFNPSPTSGGSMYVTVTKHNYLPYMGQATVPFHNPPYIPNNPGPADLAISVSRTADLNWTGGDPDGNPVTYDVYFGTTNPPTIKVSPSQPGTTYDPATMDIWTTYYCQIVVTYIDPPYSQSVSGPIWQFRTQDTVYPEWRNQGQSGPTVPPGGSITLSTQGRDNIGLDYAYLSTNESGQWVAFSGANWWDINWDYCKPIVIDHNFVDIDQTNFPVLITCTSPDFISHAQPDGDDFVFVNATNTTVFNHEIESYNSATGELIAWVTIPLLSASEDTVFYMYYGNPDCVNQEHVAETWNGNFITVQHMTGATYTALDDSSSNHWDITSMSGNPLFNQIGKIGKCVDFDGSGDYLKASGFRLPADPSYTA